MIGRSERTSYKDILSGIPVLESRPIPGFTKYAGFRGIEMNNVLERSRFLLRPTDNLPNNRTGIRVLADTSRIIDGERKLIGHLSNYDELFPDSAQILELPVNQFWLKNLDLVTELATQQDVIQIRGGKHVGRAVVPGELSLSPSAQIDGGYDDIGDQIDVALILAALKNPNIFLDATCRGLQLVLAHLTQILPDEISNHRSNTDEPIYHPIHNVASELYGESAPRVLFNLQDMKVNSYHNQGYYLETIRPFLAEWRDKYGIYVTHVSADGIVEMMVRVDGRGRITALIKQFHIEKMTGPEGRRLQQLNRWIVHQALL